MRKTRFWEEFFFFFFHAGKEMTCGFTHAAQNQRRHRVTKMLGNFRGAKASAAERFGEWKII